MADRLPVARLLQALLLALGMLVFAGSASAHAPKSAGNEHGHVSRGSVVHDHHTGSQLAAPSELTSLQGIDSESTPCSKPEGSGHPSGNCCAAACHSGVTVAAAGLQAPVEPFAPLVPIFISSLIGLPANCAERPPKS